MPLTESEIEKGWRDTFSTGNPFCPCDLKSFTKAARWAEAAASKAMPADTAPVQELFPHGAQEVAYMRSAAKALRSEDEQESAHYWALTSGVADYLEGIANRLAAPSAPVVQASLTDEEILEVWMLAVDRHVLDHATDVWIDKADVIGFARSLLAAQREKDHD